MKRFFLTFMLIAVTIQLQSCNVVAGLSYIFTPEPEQEALFALPNVRTVVFVDDRRNILHPSRLKRVLADEVTEKLLQEKILTTIISPQDVMRVSAANDKHNAPMPIQVLGEKVDASTVIYIEMVSFALTNDGQTANPFASCQVRVIDVKNKTRVFPIETAAYPVTAKLKRIDPHRVAGAGAVRELAEELTNQLGEEVSKLFYQHYTGRLGENLNRK